MKKAFLVIVVVAIIGLALSINAGSAKTEGTATSTPTLLYVYLPLVGRDICQNWDCLGRECWCATPTPQVR